MQRIYQLTFCDANGRRKDRPNGGLYITENVTEVRTLTAGGVNGLIIVEETNGKNHKTDTLLLARSKADDKGNGR